MKKLKVAGDLIYTLMATVVMQLVLQVMIYPLITHFYGDAVTGNILYFIGIIYIVPQALGTSLCNSRLVARKTHDISNRDFLPHVAIFAGLSALICGFCGLNDSGNWVFSIVYGLFSVMYMLRLFASVEFRLSSNFKGYFLYYVIISVGYLLGFGLFLLTNIWLFIFILGEGFALLYTLIWGKIFRNDGTTTYQKHISKTLYIILLSISVRDCVNQLDRVILKQTISESVVTQYNALTLIAKTVQMLVQPVNMLLLSYLTVKDSNLTKKQLLRFTGLTVLCGLVFYGVSVVGTPVFIKLFYSDFYNEIMPYNFIVNLGLILGFVTTLFMSILLTQGRTGLQMTIQCIWGVIYIGASYYFSTKYQIWGLAYVTLAANALKLLVLIVCVFLPQKKKA